MAGDRRIRLVVDADETGDFDGTARGLDRVANSGDRADASLRKLTKGHQALDAEIKKTVGSVKALRTEFERSGDLNLLGDIDKQERQVARLRKALAGFTTDDSNLFVRAGRDISEMIGEGITSHPLIAGAIIVGITAGLPAVTALVGGALGAAALVGLGGGIIARGISAAAHDARVSDAWGEIFVKAGDRLDEQSAAFVEPLIQGAAEVGDAFDHILPHIERGFRDLAPSVLDLSEGLADMIDAVANGPGLDKALFALQPLIDTLADRLPDLGEAFDSFLGHLANAGPGAQKFFDDLLVGVGGALRALGWLAEKGSQLYEVFYGLAQISTGHLAQGLQTLIDIGDNTAKSFGGFRNTTIDTATVLGLLDGSLSKVGVQAIKASEHYADMLRVINSTVTTAETVKGALADRMLNSMLSLDTATLNFAQSQTKLSDAIKESGRELDIHTEKGQTNRAAILNSVGANIQQHQALIASGASAEFAAEQYDVNTRALEDQLRAAHFTDEAIDGLIGKYRGVPKNVNTVIAIEGLTKAISQLDETLQLINGLHDRTVTVTTNQVVNHIERFTRVGSSGSVGNQAYAALERWGGAYEHAASGLLREANVYSARNPGRYMIAEPGTKGEAFVPKSGDYGRSMSILNKAASWYGASVVPRSGYGSSVTPGAGAARPIVLRLDAAGGGSALERAVLQFLTNYITLNGAGNVQAALGKRGA